MPNIGRPPLESISIYASGKIRLPTSFRPVSGRITIKKGVGNKLLISEVQKGEMGLNLSGPKKGGSSSIANIRVCFQMLFGIKWRRLVGTYKVHLIKKGVLEVRLNKKE